MDILTSKHVRKSINSEINTSLLFYCMYHIDTLESPSCAMHNETYTFIGLKAVNGKGKLPQ